MTLSPDVHGPPGPGRWPGLVDLPRHHRDVVELAARDYSDLDIANELCIALSTVRKRLTVAAELLGLPAARRQWFFVYYWNGPAAMNDVLEAIAASRGGP